MKTGKRIVVVLGMHRSGTSVLTSSLQLMGVDLGDRLIPPNQDVNAKGFFEDLDLYAFNEEMLHAINKNWHCLSPIETQDVASLQKQGFFLRAVELLRQKTSQVRIFGLKDPRVAKLLPFWQLVFSHCEFAVSYVLAIRNPLSVVQSLARRDGFPKEKSYMLWLGHVLNSLLLTPDRSRVLIDYDSFLNSPKAKLNAMAEQLDLKLDSAAMDAYLTEFIDTGLRHTEYQEDDLAMDEACPPLAHDVYTKCLAFSNNIQQTDQTELQSQTKIWIAEFERLKSNLYLVDNLTSTISDLHHAMQRWNETVGEYIRLALEQDKTVFQSIFDEKWYRNRYPDIDTAGVDSYEHFVHYGVYEGRLPSVDPMSFVGQAFLNVQEILQRTAVQDKQLAEDLMQTRLGLESRTKELIEREKANSDRMQHLFLGHEQQLNQERIEYLTLKKTYLDEVSQLRQQLEANLKSLVEQENRHSEQLQNVQRIYAQEQEQQRADYQRRENIHAAHLMAVQQQLEGKLIELFEREKQNLEQLQNQHAIHEQQMIQIQRDYQDRDQLLNSQLLDKQQEISQIRQDCLLVEQELTRKIYQMKEELVGIRSSYVWRWSQPLRTVLEKLSGKKMVLMNDGKADLYNWTSEMSLNFQQCSAEVMSHFVNDNTAASNNTCAVTGSDMSTDTIIKAAKSMDELLAYQDRDFIQCAYLTLLGREPDVQGANYYLTRMNLGISKPEIVAQMHSSVEGKRHNNQLPGMKKSIFHYRLKKIPFFGKFAFYMAKRFEIDSVDAIKSKIKISCVPEEELSIEEIKNIIENDFDAEFYLRNYDDIRINKLNPLEHYIISGWKERRNPAQYFSTEFYLENNPDVAAAGINPFVHYLTVGKHESRKIKGVRDVGKNGEIILYEDEASSLVSNPDISEILKLSKSKIVEQISSNFNPDRMHIHWVIPDFTRGGGGHMTIFRMVRWLEFFGHECTVWILNPTVHKSGDEAYQNIVKHYQPIVANVFLISDEHYPAQGDALIATAWQTVNHVEQAAGFLEKFYFIQDFEPNFYPMGAMHLLAENTYKKGLAALCASTWLKALVELKYNGWARSFNLAYDPELYNTQNVSRNNCKIKIAVYSRIGTARRAVELAFAGLEVLARTRNDFEVHLFGDFHDFDSAPFHCVVHGILNPVALARLYKQSNIGMCFSATNYSLVPQEMMACGLPVVELDVESTRAIFPDNVVTWTKPDPYDIAERLSILIENHELRDVQALGALDWVGQFSWENSARIIEESIKDKLMEKHQPVAQKKSDSVVATVVVPTFNGGEIFKIVFNAVKSQRTPWNYEILIVDSGSTDGTVDFLNNYSDITLISIPNHEFQHGRTRNLAANNAQGDYIVFLTQDAIPVGEFWLYNLVISLQHYPCAAGAFGRHVAHDDASIFTKHDLESHFSAFDEKSLIVSKNTDPSRFENDIGWRQFLHFFSDNCACLRKSVFNVHPYPEVKYGEDQLWAQQIINAGFEKVYAISAVVKHSHDYSPEETFSRAKTEADYFNYYFGYTMISKSDVDAVLTDARKKDFEFALSYGLDSDVLVLREALAVARINGWLAGQNLSCSLFSAENTARSPF